MDLPHPPDTWRGAGADTAIDWVRLLDGPAGDLIWERPFFTKAAAAAWWERFNCQPFSPCLPGEAELGTGGLGIATAIAMEDANGDGSDDIFLTRNTTAMAVDRRTGTPIGSVGSNDNCFPTPTWPISDLDSDGRADVITIAERDPVNTQWGDCQVSALGWDGTVIWRTAIPWHFGYGPWLELGDLTGDGSPDVSFGFDVPWCTSCGTVPPGRAAFDGRSGKQLWTGPPAPHFFVEDLDGDRGEDLMLVSPDHITTISGATGAELMRVDRDPDADVVVSGPRSDLDGVGISDPILHSGPYWGRKFLAISSRDGSTLWATSIFVYPLGADLNGNGRDDVFDFVYDGPGNHRVELRDGGTLNLLGSLPWHGPDYWPHPRDVHAADVSDEPGVEVVVGRSAFRFDGTALWTAP